MRPSFHPFLVNEPFGDPAVFVDFLFEPRALLLDLGDLRTLPPRKLLRISDIFVSHCHMDHFMGFDWWLRISLGREHRVRLYGPPGFLKQVEHKLSAYTWNLVRSYDTDLTLVVTEVDPAGTGRRAWFHCRRAFLKEAEETVHVGDGVLLEEHGFRVRSVFLDHRTPSLAFALEESRHVNIWKNRLAERGLAVGPWLQTLKRAALADLAPDTPIQAPRVGGGSANLPLGELLADVVRIVPGTKLAYVTDAVFHERNARHVIDLARDADLLFIEAVFTHDLAPRAAEKCHLTAAQAGWLAHRAGVRAVQPFHFSPIYREREQELRAELDTAFRSGRLPVGSPGDEAAVVA